MKLITTGKYEQSQLYGSITPAKPLIDIFLKPTYYFGKLRITEMSESVYKALADVTRRRILKLLGERSMTAGEIAEQFQLAKSTLSGHFNVLKAANLIQEERRGTVILYSLNVTVMEEALVVIMDLLKIGKETNHVRRNDKNK